jgi:DNA-binding beta-propeller fold protein YncE
MTLWVTNNASRTNRGSLAQIDHKTGKPGKEIPVKDPMYLTPDEGSAIVVDEAFSQLDYGAAIGMVAPAPAPKVFELEHR